MVNNNQIPIEVKKPFETVQELKNEIPSLEEFMKNYESDDKISNSYNAELGSYGGVEVPKSSGPCYYANPDCTCYTSQDWIQLYVGCLAEGCPNHKDPFSWVHRSCGYPIYISTNLQLKCIMCDRPSHMSDWRFNCHQPSHPGDWENKTTFASFSNALSYMNARISNRVPEVRSKTRAIVMKMLDDQGW